MKPFPRVPMADPEDIQHLLKKPQPAPYVDPDPPLLNDVGALRKQVCEVKTDLNTNLLLTVLNLIILSVLLGRSLAA